MPNGAYLIDSNILIRWVKPDDRDYLLVNRVLESLIQQGSTLSYTSQNLAEFWNTCTRPPDRNGYGLSTEEADLRAGLSKTPWIFFLTAWPCIGSGES